MADVVDTLCCHRWFTLANNCLYYFESPDSVKPKGTIPLESLHVREATDSKRPNCFEIIAEQAADGARGGASVKVCYWLDSNCPCTSL